LCHENKANIDGRRKIIKNAESYAKQTGRSLSELDEKYLEALTTEHSEVTQVSPRLRKLVGAVRLPADFDEKKERGAYL